MFDHHKYVKQTKGCRDGGKEITGDDPVGVQA
jgi:hypothetical protein